jgi:hypothetical protein
MVAWAIPAIGVGMQVAGGLMQRDDAQKNATAQAQARNSVLLDYLKKQQGLETEGRGFLDNTMAGYAPGAQDSLLAGKQDARTAAATTAMGPMSDPNSVTVSGSAPTAVRGEIAKRMLSAFQGATQRAKAMGQLSGYGDQWVENNSGIADSARRIGTLNNFSRGNTGILPSQMDLAQMAATKQPSIWGTALSAGGSCLTAASGSLERLNSTGRANPWREGSIDRVRTAGVDF